MKSLALVAVALAACSATYTPPVRAAHGGAPRRLDRVQLDVADTDANIPGAALRIPVARDVALEVGGEVGGEAGDGRVVAGWPVWAMGFVGGRYTLASDAGDGETHPAADVELGVGAGTGGLDQDEPVSGAAAGAYLGAGVGVGEDRFGVFARGRLQVTRAADLPSTTWASAVAGIEAGGDTVRVRLAGGVARYGNADDAAVLPVVELGLALGGGQP